MKQLQAPTVRRTGESAAQTPVVRPRERRALETARATTPSLPEWAASRIAWCGTVNLARGPVRYLTSGLPTLSQQEKTELRRTVAEFEALSKPADGDDERKHVAVTKAMLALGSANMSEAGAQAKGEAYLFALAELPAWAVDVAIGLWIKGDVESVEESEFKWMPSAAVLSRVASEQIEPYKQLIHDGLALLSAKRLEELMT